MTACTYSAEAKALMLELVQSHAPRKAEELLIKRMPGDVPPYNAIRNARAAYLLSVSVASARELAPRQPAGKLSFDPIKQPVRAPLTFEEKMARVAAGAALVAVRPLRKPAPNFTLGGVASTSL